MGARERTRQHPHPHYSIDVVSSRLTRGSPVSGSTADESLSKAHNSLQNTEVMSWRGPSDAGGAWESWHAFILSNAQDLWQSASHVFPAPSLHFDRNCVSAFDILPSTHDLNSESLSLWHPFLAASSPTRPGAQQLDSKAESANPD